MAFSNHLKTALVSAFLLKRPSWGFHVELQESILLSHSCNLALGVSYTRLLTDIIPPVYAKGKDR